MIETGQLTIKTVQDHVLDALRDEIVTGRLKPGSNLVLNVLSKRLGVSTQPIRVALTKLEAEGLVRQPARRGAIIVAPLEIEDLEEIQAIRSGLEGLAARLGAPALTDSSIDRMRRLLTRLQDVGSDRRVDAYLRQQWELQDVCYAAAARPRLLSLITDHRKRAERYIRLAVSSPLGFSGSLHYQEAFVAACADRSARRAEEVIRQALWWTATEVAPAIAKQSGHVIPRGDEPSATETPDF